MPYEGSSSEPVFHNQNITTINTNSNDPLRSLDQTNTHGNTFGTIRSCKYQLTCDKCEGDSSDPDRRIKRCHRYVYVESSNRRYHYKCALMDNVQVDLTGLTDDQKRELEES